MAIINNIHDEFKPYIKSLCSFVTHLIINYDNDNSEEYGLLENINYITLAINNSLLGLMSDKTKKIIDHETEDNLILFNQVWTIFQDEINPNYKFDKYNIVGCISKTPFDIFAKTEDAFNDPFFIHTDIQNDMSYRITFGCGQLGFHINNIKISEDEFSDQLFLFVSSCVMIVKKLISIQITKSVYDIVSKNNDYNDIENMVNDIRVREDVFTNMANTLDDDGIVLFNDIINKNIETKDGKSSFISLREKSLMTMYNSDEYLIPTLKKHIEDIRNVKNIFSPKDKAEMVANVLGDRDIIINKKEIGAMSLLDENMKSILADLFEVLINYEDSYILNSIMVVDGDDESPETFCNSFPILMLYDINSNYSIISSYDMIEVDEVRELFQEVQNYIIQIYIRNGLAIDFVDNYERIFNESGVSDEIKEAISNNSDDDDNEEEITIEDDDTTKSNSKVKEYSDNKTKNRISYNEPADKFSIITFGELVEDNLQSFFKEIEVQLQLNITNCEDIYKALRYLSNCTTKEYYSDDNLIDFSFIGDALSSDSFIINVSSNRNLLDSIIVFYDDDMDKYTAIRYGDRFGEYCSLDERNKFYKYYRIRESDINLNITYKGGSYNLALDQLCDYLKIDNDCIIDDKYTHDITAWVLSTISNLFLRKYIGKCKGIDLKYNNPSHYRYMNRLDTYNTSKVISCFEYYADNHIIDTYDIDNILNVFYFKKLNKKSTFIELENESNRVIVSLFDGVSSRVNDGFQLIAKDNMPYLVNPGKYFSLITTIDNEFDEDHEAYNYLLYIDSLGDTSIQDFYKEMISILKYTKMCIEDNNNSKTTKHKTNRK